MDDLHSLLRQSSVNLLSSDNLFFNSPGGLTSWTTVSSVEGGGHPCTIVKERMAVEKLLRWETLVVTHCSQQSWGTVKIEGFQIAISFHIASPMAGNVTVAIPKQTLSAGSKGQPPPTQPLPLDISLWPQRPRLAHPSPELLKRVCPEWEMHFSKLEGYSEGGTLG